MLNVKEISGDDSKKNVRCPVCSNCIEATKELGLNVWTSEVHYKIGFDVCAGIYKKSLSFFKECNE